MHIEIAINVDGEVGGGPIDVIFEGLLIWINGVPSSALAPQQHRDRREKALTIHYCDHRGRLRHHGLWFLWLLGFAWQSIWREGIGNRNRLLDLAGSN